MQGDEETNTNSAARGAPHGMEETRTRKEIGARDIDRGRGMADTEEVRAKDRLRWTVLHSVGEDANPPIRGAGRANSISRDDPSAPTPHLVKCGTESLDGWTANFDGIVSPRELGSFGGSPLLSDVDPPRDSDLAVHDEQFAMVAVGESSGAELSFERRDRGKLLNEGACVVERPPEGARRLEAPE
jgi:hypothetical protein